MTVRILSQSEFASIVAPSRTVQPPSAEPSPPPQATPTTKPDEVVRPHAMLSAKSLADPRAKRALAKLATFSDDERVVQLCNIEAMAQIAAWDESFRPDGLVAYARAAERIAGNRVSAGGAAFRSLGRWYGHSYGCDLSPDHKRVVAFQFQVGKPIPEKQWNDLALPSGDTLD